MKKTKVILTPKQKEFANKLVSKMLRGSDKETSLKLAYYHLVNHIQW